MSLKSIYQSAFIAKHWILCAVIFIFFIFFSALKVNNSSVGMFCEYEPIGCPEETTVFNTQSRPIRSDEWLVSTPLLLAQNIDNDKAHTNLIGLETAIPFLHESVYWNWSALFKPFVLPTLFFDVEPTITFIRFGPIIALAAVAFLLFKQLGISTFNSAALAAALLFTSFIQWWSAFLVITYPLLLLLISFWWLSKKKSNIVLKALLLILCVFVMSFNLHILYPPYQIPLFLLCLFICIGALLEKKYFKEKKRLIATVLIVLTAVIISGLLFMQYLATFSQELHAVQNTSYPGQRISTGGSFPLFRVFSGFYDIQLLDDAKPMGVINQSEAAGFFTIFLFLLPVIGVNEYITRKKYKKNDWLILSLVAYILFIAGWMLLGYPSWLAKYTLLERVPVARANIGLGIAGFLLTILYVFRYKVYIPNAWWKYCLGFAGFITILLTGLYLRTTFPLYIQSLPKIILISSISAFLILSAICQWKKTFATTLLLWSIVTAGTVHPIRRGLDPITDSQFIQQVIDINQNSPAKWAVYNSRFLSPLLYANGIQSATGVYVYPQKDWWMLFDKDAANRDIWNRYAHMYFVEPDDAHDESIRFKLLATDFFVISISPCNALFDTLDIIYLVSNTPLNGECLVSLKDSHYHHNIYIYQRTP